MNINGRNSGMIDVPAVTLQNAVSGTANGVTLPLDANSATVLLTFTGASTPALTFIVEHTLDNTNYLASYVKDLVSVALAFVNSVALGGTVLRYEFTPPPGCLGVRARCSAVVTGTGTVTAVERRRV